MGGSLQSGNPIAMDKGAPRFRFDYMMGATRTTTKITKMDAFALKRVPETGKEWAKADVQRREGWTLTVLGIDL